MKPLSRFMISMLEAARRSPIGQVSGFGYGDGIHSIVTGRALIARGLFDSQTVRGGNEQKFTLTVEGRAAIEHRLELAIRLRSLVRERGVVRLPRVRLRQHVVGGVNPPDQSGKILSGVGRSVLQALDQPQVRGLDADVVRAGRNLQIVVVRVVHVDLLSGPAFVFA